MKKKIEYTHNGSFGRSFGLLFRALFNILAFTFFWYALTVANIPLIVGATALLTAAILLNLIFPLLKK